MRVHLLGLPHTQTTAAFSWCAYTQKIRKLANMLTATGHEVILYAGEENEAAVAELVPIVTREDQATWYGRFDWSRDVMTEFDPDSPGWAAMNARAISAVKQRMQPGDLLGITMGLSQKPVADALPELLPVEVGIGYSGVWAPYRVFESYAWMHHLAGLRREDDARFFDEVIPNSFEPEAFPLGAGDGGYFLFLGRFIRRKGVQIAAEATARLGMPLVMAGQGVVESDGHRYRGIDVELEGDHLTHVGVVDPVQRAKLLGGAIAVFVPTIYLEPFGGVAVEAMLCGTPVITTDFGAFVETVRHGRDGYRCNMLAEFIAAARMAPGLERATIREHAVRRFSVGSVAPMYDTYLSRLATLHGEGWYAAA